MVREFATLCHTTRWTVLASILGIVVDAKRCRLLLLCGKHLKAELNEHRSHRWTLRQLNKAK